MKNKTFTLRLHLRGGNWYDTSVNANANLTPWGKGKVHPTKFQVLFEGALLGVSFEEMAAGVDL